ncbi:unnamed protein product, partial [Urochloa humidicola]
HHDASRTSEAAATPFCCHGGAILLLALPPSTTSHRHRSHRILREMQAVRALVLQHLRLRALPSVAARGGGAGPPAVTQCWFARGISAPAEQNGANGDGSSGSESAVRARVVDLVKKFDKIDADKVTETADFQKDLSLDSLDRVELVMAFEQEFSIEIPDDKADKLTCCADVAKYIISESVQ